MSDKNSPQEFATPRRRDRQITDEARLKTILAESEIGYLATSADDQPFLTPLTYWFDGERIYFHGAKKGRTRSNIEANPKVCFSVAERGRYLPADTALNFGVEYRSVVVFGRATLIIEDKEKTYALQGLLDRYFSHLKSGENYRPITQRELDLTAVFAIDIDGISGKEKVAGSTFPTEGLLRAFDSLDEVNEG